ncbi:GntP family permease [Rhodopirellula halodulae]|uniref:GntP family permease n=1 Tax=Rhodopirellula halodulae TaxID=2894198 RepID=UPI001E4FA7DA|nr:GntP family permease [Rhodopirellula sp. JC737]MCC9654490.1 GntP family permease [Rhodopirellula sp. JC737]
MTIWWLVALAVTLVLVSILAFRLHPFLSLLSAALLVATLTTPGQLQQFADARLEDGKFTQAEAAEFVTQSASSRVADAFGATAGSIGIVIALASVIGGLLMQSGAAARIVDTMLRWTGEQRAPEAMAAASFVLGIPVFFDTVFYLMLPLARSLRRKTGKNYVLFILAILAGGSITHSLIPPTPGPLQVAAFLEVEVGAMLIAGLGIGSVTSVMALIAARVINRLVDLPLREEEGKETRSGTQTLASVSGDAEAGATKPPLWMALFPIALPVALIAMGSTLKSIGVSETTAEAAWFEWLIQLGDKNLALGLGCVVAFGLMRWVPVDQRRPMVSAAIASAGSIILITSAGGAMGKTLYHAGIAEVIGSVAKGFPGLWLLPLAFVVTTAIRTIQGSATIAMITSASILQSLALSGDLPFHPVYLAMAIGAGSKPISWMTDSAFWIIKEMTGMTEQEALRTISPMSAAVGLSALLVTVIAAAVFPAI